MLIRQACLSDTPQITSLGRELLNLHFGFDSVYYQLEENFADSFSNWVKNQIDTSHYFLLVAEENNKIIGFISGFLKSLYPWFHTKAVGHISYLIVKPESRQKGIARLLEEAARQWFKEKNVSYVEVYVDEQNSVAQKTWHSLGFSPFKKFLRKTI